MKESVFQFTNPVLKHLEFSIHETFKSNGPLKMEISITPNCRYNETVNGTHETATVSVSLCIGSNDDTTPFNILAEEEATFKWEKNSVSPEQLESLINQNAVALLISYLRPIISNITAASPYPAYNLPYINLTNTVKDRE